MRKVYLMQIVRTVFCSRPPSNHWQNITRATDGHCAVPLFKGIILDTDASVKYW